MTTLASDISRSTLSSIAAQTAAISRQSLQAAQRRIRIWRDMEHLAGQPDHILNDIGISRCEIMSVVRYGGRDASRRRRP